MVSNCTIGINDLFFNYNKSYVKKIIGEANSYVIRNNLKKWISTLKFSDLELSIDNVEIIVMGKNLKNFIRYHKDKFKNISDTLLYHILYYLQYSYHNNIEIEDFPYIVYINNIIYNPLYFQ
tara:strand:+ start:225 stop:590 length:366 start_codon:yes stop_codon:yes gene_type:complete